MKQEGHREAETKSSFCISQEHNEFIRIPDGIPQVVVMHANFDTSMHDREMLIYDN